MAKKKGNKIVTLVVVVLLLGALGTGAMIGYPLYQKWKAASMVNVELDEQTAVFIPTGSSAKDVADLLKSEGYIKDKATFELIAGEMNYKKQKVVPGKYILETKMTNKELVTLLRGGYGRKSITVTFNASTVKTLNNLAVEVAPSIEASQEDLKAYLNDPEIHRKYGLTDKTFLTLFLPNTYKLLWNTSAEEFVSRMAQEYKNFWTDERKAKAKTLNLSQSEVAILATVTEAEQQRFAEEWPRIAGLYINRLKRGQKLQSDPTVIYGIGDFSITRVLYKHLEYDSPYNTYMYKGLPPGPIRLPNPEVMKAVLDYEKHEFIYMCAKPKTGGKHNFAKSYKQHLVYARQYQRWMDAGQPQ
jgi:UPF0755 protein